MGNIQKILSARYLILDYLREHKQTCTDPKCNESVNVVAFLAHALGMDGFAMRGPVVERLRWYDVNCNRNGCVHVDDSPSDPANTLHPKADVRRIDPADGQREQ